MQKCIHLQFRSRRTQMRSRSFVIPILLEHLDATIVINAIKRGPSDEGEPVNFHDYAGDVDRVQQEDT